ncbi:MAG: hypothetical protein ACREQW_05450 [Candidatus Binatia bacterium]
MRLIATVSSRDNFGAGSPASIFNSIDEDYQRILKRRLPLSSESTEATGGWAFKPQEKNISSHHPKPQLSAKSVLSRYMKLAIPT